MIELFNSYVDWKILSHFLINPTTSFHIKQLSRILDVSPASVSKAVKYLEAEKVLVKEEIGLAHLYHLNHDNPIVAPLKKAYGLSFILSARPKEIFLEADPNIISMALFGSFADGSFDEKVMSISWWLLPQRKKNMWMR